MIYCLVADYGKSEMTAKCVQAIDDHAGRDHRTLILHQPQYSYTMPGGFTKAMNELLYAAKYAAEGVFVVNNDTEVVTHDFIGKVLDFVKSKPKAGVVACQELLAGYPPQETHEVKYGGFGFCYITKECLNTVGLLDEHFNPGYYEDYDFGVRAWLAGYSCWHFRDVEYNHKRGGTFEQLQREGRVAYPSTQAAYFHLKYAHIPIIDGEPEEATLAKIKRFNSRFWQS